MEPDPYKDIRSSASFLHVGMQVAATVVGFTGAGLLLDRWLGTMPWLTLVGAIVGMIGLFSLVFRMNQDLTKAAQTRQAKTQHTADSTPPPRDQITGDAS